MSVVGPMGKGSRYGWCFSPLWWWWWWWWWEWFATVVGAPRLGCMGLDGEGARRLTQPTLMCSRRVIQ